MAPRAKGVQTKKFEHGDAQKALVKMIIIDELPFSVVEQERFKECMETAFPGFQIPSTEMISTDCAKLFLEEKLKLKGLIKKTKQRICLTLDTWKSNQSVNYLCIAAHFIDDKWKLHKKIIGFAPIVSDEGEEIGRVVENCLLDWEINNVLTISTCNRSSYDAAIAYLRDRLSNTVFDSKFLHLKCVVDFTNMMVKEFLKDHDKPITQARTMINFVIQSRARIAKFRQCAREYVKSAREYGLDLFKYCDKEFKMSSETALFLDSPTSWASTFKMLYVSEKFEVVFQKFGQNDPAYAHELLHNCGDLGYGDWEKVRRVVMFLETFYRSTENILKSYVTANKFLDEISTIDFHLDNWGKSCGWNESDMDKALNMKWKFMECWGDVEKSNMLIYVANILDPRSRTDLMENYFMNMYKHEYTDDGEKLWKKKAEFVIAAIYELFNEYVGMAGGSQQKANFQSSGYKQYLYEDTSHLGLFMKHEVGFGGNVDCKTEIDIYLNEDSIEDFAGFDILLWWKYNSARYPILSKMAKDVLAIPVLVTPPESAYSTSGGNLLDDFRSSSSPSKVEALVCTQDWISKSSKKTNVVKGSIDLDKFVKGMCKHMKGTTV